MITILASLVWPLSADDDRESGEGVESKLDIVIIQFFEVLRGSVVHILLQNQYIAMILSSIGIGIGYWVLVLLEASIIGYWVPCLVSF